MLLRKYFLTCFTVQKYIFWLLGMSALVSIYFYYIYYPIHNEDRTYFLIYFFIAAFLYGGYKVFQNFIGSKKISFTPLRILQVFLIQLLVVCGFFTAVSGGGVLLGSVVFLKILTLLVGALLIWFIMYGVGGRVVRYFQFFHIEDPGFRIFSQLGLGFAISMCGIFLLAAVGQYNSWILGVFGFICFVIAFPSFKEATKKLKTPIASYNISSTNSSLRLMIDEIHILIITLLLSVNFLSVYRPFPIGWDDLGAYMNYPKLLAESGGLESLGKMYLWELYTGIGYVFGNQTFAFVLNSFSGVIVAFVVFIALKYLYPKSEKTLFSVPLLGVLILLMMPMAIFQLAKDMKLDYGLLSFSIMGLYMLYSIFFAEGKFSHKKSLSALFVVGIFIGVTFSIKITSLLLFLGCIAALSYKKFGLYGFFGFLSTFFGIFTFLGLWKIMNVIFESENEVFITAFSFVTFGFGILLFILGVIKKKKSVVPFQNFIGELGVLILGFIIAVSPWIVKHSGEIKEDTIVTSTTYVSGVSHAYRPDYSLIYSEEELIEKKNSINKLGMTASGVTSNEDLGRYFGYEKGINNYLKLPWNLSFQVNQKGEFTDITYIFFALVPLIFLFLPYKKESYKYPIIGAYILGILYFIPGIKIPIGVSEGTIILAHLQNPISLLGTEFFSYFSLPFGYSIILVGVMLPFVYLHYTLKENKLTQIFLINYAFTAVYGFLWTISSFGIVWYGVVLYFTILVMISLCIAAAEEENSSTSRSCVYMVLGIIWFYVFYSSIPHAVTNFTSAGYSQYKIGAQSQEKALMTKHPEYFSILLELNITEDAQQEMFINYKTQLLEVVDDIPDSEALIASLAKIPNIPSLNGVLNQLVQVDYGQGNTGKQIELLQQSLYEDIIHPEEDVRNKRNIFRVGTFLKYFISENHLRLFDDSLIERFSDYIYDDDPILTLERMKKLGLSYILLDLNAATIDRAEGKFLTKRYEDLLIFLAESDIELIETDSICLKVALDTYKKDKNIEKYAVIAGVNHGKRQEKGFICLTELVKLIQTEDITPTNKTYLSPYKNILTEKEVPVTETENVQKTLAPYINGGFKALFYLKN